MSQGMQLITSLRPHARLAQQLRCFEAWRALGFRVRSFNGAMEAKALVAAGVPEADIVTLPDAQTGKAVHGRPVPLTLPLLRRIAAESPTAAVVLTEPDIFPAMRTAGAIGFFLSQSGGAVGLAREDCVALECAGIADFNPWRRGIDSFFLHPSRLPHVIAGLERCAAVDRICLGIPGSDMLLAAVIRDPRVGGRLADGGVLLHETHGSENGRLAELQHLLPDFERLTGIAGRDAGKSAAAFEALVAADAAITAGVDAPREMARALYFAPVTLRPGLAAMNVAARLGALGPSIGWHLRLPAIAALAELEIAAPKADLGRAIEFFMINPDPQFRFYQRLQAILFCLACRMVRPDFRRPATDYSETDRGAHAKALAAMMQSAPQGTPLRRTQIAQLFGEDLLDLGTFNTRLFNFLVENCETDDERQLLTEIATTIRSIPHAA